MNNLQHQCKICRRELNKKKAEQLLWELNAPARWVAWIVPAPNCRCFQNSRMRCWYRDGFSIHGGIFCHASSIHGLKNRQFVLCRDHLWNICLSSCVTRSGENGFATEESTHTHTAEAREWETREIPQKRKTRIFYALNCFKLIQPALYEFATW